MNKILVNIIRKNALNVAIIILFIISAVYMAQFHELWADEAQSWLIARDLSASEILSYIRYEGTPPLWVLTIKLFMYLGISYEKFYIIPIIFMSLGLLFTYSKYDIPWYIKILFPFTYFVFYQTTIVVRSYSLLLLALSLTFYYFPRRYQNPWKYWLSLTYLMGISLHAFLLAGGFWIISLALLIQNKEKIESNQRKNIIISLCLTTINLLLTTIIIMPNSNVGFGGDGGENIFYVIGETTLASSNTIMQVISTIVFVLLISYIEYYRFKQNQDTYVLIESIEKLFIILPLIAFYIVVYAQVRYFSILYFCLFLFLIINKDIPGIKVFLLIMMCIQVTWNISSCKVDYAEKYAYGEEIHDFLVQIDYQNKIVDTINYHITEIMPYFNENPFYHSYHTDKAFYSWNINSGYDDVNQLINNSADIYIIPVVNDKIYNENTLYIKNPTIKAFLNDIDYDKYNVYSFEAILPQKNRINESDTFLIFVNDKVDKEMHEKYIMLNEENRIFTDSY